jgi:hypothetical protein
MGMATDLFPGTKSKDNLLIYKLLFPRLSGEKIVFCQDLYQLISQKSGNVGGWVVDL